MKNQRHTNEERILFETLRMVSPGSALYEGLESILRARTGALVVLGDSEEVLSLVNGGFRIDSEATPSSMYELAKMDGAMVLSRDGKRILYANAHLTPDPSVSTVETGTRHRTAERVAKQTGEIVISISQRRNVVTLYRGNMRYMLQDVSVLLAKANQAISTLEKYKSVLEQALINLTALEFEDLATLVDVATCLQRAQMVSRVAKEIERYIMELGVEGRLVSMQLDELMVGIENEGLMIIKDYHQKEEEDAADEIVAALEAWTSDDLLDMGLILRLLGHGGAMNSLDIPVTPRGYRVLHKIPRLPATVIENVVRVFSTLPEILEASIEELDDVEGIGAVRAKAVKDGLRRLREQVLLDRHL